MAKLANRVSDEVMRQRSEVCGEVALGARTRGEDGGNECGSRQQWIWHPFYWPRGGEMRGRAASMAGGGGD
jgi:hypothetical protein